MSGIFGSLANAPATLVIRGAHLVDPAAGTDAIGDLAMLDGVIVADAPAGAEEIDATGLVLAPGFCDLHTHLRQPGTTGAETIASGARAAARGGFTTICAMPNTDPALDAPAVVGRVLALAADASCRVQVIGAATLGRSGESPVELAALASAGAVAFSDDGAAVPGPEPAEAIFRGVAATGLPLIEHAEDPSHAGDGVMRAGPTATRLGLRPWPPEAELAIVERDIALAGATGAHLHLTHLSTAAAIEAVRAAKARGVAVTCDVTPHHLALADDWVAGHRTFAWEDPHIAHASLAYDGTCRVNPPLASRDDARALLAAVADGTVDAIATDHAPHTSDRKLVPFDEAAPGLIGLETALSLGLAAVEAGVLELAGLLTALSARPAAIIGEARGLVPGMPGDLVLFDPAARWRVEADSLASASTNTPLLGMELPGLVRLTVAGGRVTYRS